MLIDTNTLNTLPDRELASGFAEVIKYGLIRDAEFFEWQEKNMNALMARYVVSLSVLYSTISMFSLLESHACVCCSGPLQGSKCFGLCY